MLANRILRQLTQKLVAHPQLITISYNKNLLSSPQYFFSSKNKNYEDNDHETEPKKKSFDKLNKRGVFRGQGNETNRDSQNSGLSNILKMYRIRQSSNKGSYNSNFAECCKHISSHYRKDNHNQFVQHRQELEKILKVVPNLDFQSFQLLQLLNVLDFLRIIGRIETFCNTRTYDTSRNKVFSIITRYLNEGGDITISQLIVLFCKITPLNYPQISTLSMRLLEKLKAEKEEHGNLPFPIYQVFITIKSLSKKAYLSYPDKLILQILLQDLRNRQKQIDKNLQIQLAKALIDLDLPSALADTQSLTTFYQILDRTVTTIRKSRGTDLSHYLIECPKNEFPQHKQTVNVIYSKLLERIAHPDLHIYPFSILTQCFKHLNPSDISDDDKIIVINRLEDIIEKKTPNARKNLQFDIASLIEAGFFNSVADKLEDIMQQPTFQISWNLPYQYSLQGLVFPVNRMLQKGTKAANFQLQSNFLKAAVSIAIQSRLQPQSQQLASLLGMIKQNIDKANWQEVGVDWLVKISMYSPKLVQVFHREYGTLFKKRIQPLQQELKSDFSTQLGSMVKNLSYWQYFFLIEEIDQNLPSQLLFKMSIFTFSLCSSRQINRMNVQIHVKNILLASLLTKASIGFGKLGKKQQQISTNNMISLLFLYCHQLYSGSNTFIELFLRSVLEIIKNYDKLNRTTLHHANFLLMKILNIKNKRIYNSTLMSDVVREIMKSPIILTGDSLNQHLKTTVLRIALQKNMLSYLNLPKINQQYLTSSELQHLNTLLGRYKVTTFTHQTLVFILKAPSISTSTLKNHMGEVQTLINQASLTQLQQYLISFSLERSKFSDMILTKLVEQLLKKLVVEEIDFIRIIGNINLALAEINSSLLLKLLEEITNQLCLNLPALLLADHRKFLSILTKYNIDFRNYATKLLEYATNTRERGSFIVQIVYELSRTQTLSHLDLQLLDNYFMLQPDSYVRLLALYQPSIPSIQSKLVKASKYQISPISNNLLTHYLQNKYAVRFNKQQIEEQLLVSATPKIQQLIGQLEKHGATVTVQDIGIDKVYLIGQQFVIAISDRNKSSQFSCIERALHFLFPKRQISLMGLQVDVRSLQHLLSSMSQGLSMPQQSIESISRSLSES